MRDIIALNCLVCHDEPQQFGATVPLRSWADFHVDSERSTPAPLFQDAADRLRATDHRRMPPDGVPMSAVEKARLLEWLDSGAHQYRCDGNTPLPAETLPLPPTCETGETHPWQNADDVDDDQVALLEDMFPGRDCLACHQQEGDAEEVLLGGTVFRGIRERDRCFGWPDDGSDTDVHVVITDSTGKVFDLPVRRSGNFFIHEDEHGALQPPYTAEVWNGNEVRRMMGEQTITSCNRCHTDVGTLPAGVTGQNPAPGRIVAPGFY